MRLKLSILGLTAMLALSACAEGFGTPTNDGTPPAMRWDGVEAGRTWTVATMNAIDDHGVILPETVPADIADWCPGYPTASYNERKEFWTGILSALSFHESTWNPRAVGGGGLWYGLVQILPSTARLYGCKARTGSALKDGPANLSCAVRILSHTIPRDGVVAAGGRGIAADWGPFHSARKREDIRTWVSQQSYCQG